MLEIYLKTDQNWPKHVIDKWNNHDSFPGD